MITRQEFLSNWISALRSERFAKGEEMYRNDATGCYCTLGVAAEVMREKTNGHDLYDSLVAVYKLLPEVYPNDDSFWTKIIDKNDGRNGEKVHTFEEMADFIEANIKP